jgi:transcriptional regulator with XRE-family HTH domain
MISLAKALRQKRHERGYTQTDVANFIQVSLRQYMNYEKDKLPPHDQLLKLNTLFNYHFEIHIYGR